MDKREPNLEKISVINEEKSIVFTKRKGVPSSRRGRGYSQKEIAGASANIGLANQNVSKVRAFHIPVDNLRRSSHPENVNKLTKVLDRYLQSKKAKNRGKKQTRTKDKTVTTKTSK